MSRLSARHGYLSRAGWQEPLSAVAEIRTLDFPLTRRALWPSELQGLKCG